jgi:NAD(P)-dependent dehydrogenase (short-subunit alcohol dehydrogenase family)
MFNRWADEVGEAANGINAIIPLGRVSGPEEIAAAAGWLLSDASSYLTGQAVIVDGGFSIA